MSESLPATKLNLEIRYQYQQDPAGYVAILYVQDTPIKYLTRSSSEELNLLEFTAVTKFAELFKEGLRL